MGYGFNGEILSRPVSANHEAARDVLGGLVSSIHRVLGVHSIDGNDPEPQYTWTLLAAGSGYQLNLEKLIRAMRIAAPRPVPR
ncbi:MAG TPA: hypothetical protein VGN17_07170 [Bryobacteraceae bacterium]|jgi:hypothetical protein